MTKNDWLDAGEQIKQLVQDAVDSKDFSQLGNTISNVVNDAMNELEASLQETVKKNASSNQMKWQYRPTNQEAAERIRQEMRNRERKKAPVVVKSKVQGEISGNVMKWMGFSMGGIFGLSAALVALTGAALGISVALPVGILGLFFVGSMGLGISGNQKAAFAKRFRRYCSIMGERTYCKIEELAAATGQNVKFVRQDLKKMIEQGFFREGYMDTQETLLITDRETYHQYQVTQEEYERRKAKEVSSVKDTVSHQNASDLPAECRELIEEGQKYIQHVHECNDKIPGEEISSKLDRLELVITRIFREVEKNPSVAGDLKKMMSYYLPTTKKLLDAYCELDAQPVRGQNIETTKREIENALDTINGAFENLLDSFFQDAAWDISSDISVLNTMFAQEGLTGSDF